MAKRLGDILLDKAHRKLRLVRKAYGLKQEEAALLLKVGLNTIRRYEAGQRSPDLEFIAKFISVFSVDPAWILSSADTPFRISDNAPIGELKELIYLTEIPEIKRALLSELDKLKAIFESKIKEHEKTIKVDQDTILKKRKENLQEILKELRKQKAQGKKKAGNGILGYDMLTGKAKK